MNKNNRKRGVALIISYMVIAVLTILGTVFIARSISESNTAKRFVDSTRAFWLAEAGVHKGIYALKNEDWSGWTVINSTVRSLVTALGSSGDYNVTISGVNSTYVNITSTGYVPNMATTRPVQRTVRVQYKSTAPFNYAAFGTSSVSLSGNSITDSYNSANGPYGGSNVFHNGDVGTNGTGVGSISISGNAYIYGDANTGPGGTVKVSPPSSLGPGSRVSGTIEDECNEVLVPVVVDPALVDLNSSGKLTLGGNGFKTIYAGNYKYQSISISGNYALTLEDNVNLYLTDTGQALSITANGRIIVSGRATIYTDGDCLIAGNGVLNTATVPGNFILYGTNTSDNIAVSGNSDFYGVVYAPNATVSISGNGDIFGAVIGRIVNDSGNAALHYDEALRNIGQGSYGFQWWQEIYLPQ